MTKAQLQSKIASMADKNGITQYEAAMVLYTQENTKESEAKGNKEKLKEIIKTAMERRSEKAHAILIPDSDQYATAYQYEQSQPKWEHDLAHTLIAPEILNRIHSHTSTTCFTVKALAEDASQCLVEKINAGGTVPGNGSKGSK